MNDGDLDGILEFLQGAERMKVLTRSGWTSAGERESIAAHSWRLCLMAMLVGHGRPELDLGRLLQICVVHDLGEAIAGDVPAPEQATDPDRAARERADLGRLAAPLPTPLRDRILALYDEYQAGSTPEARTARGLDKLETILQHTQGLNPPGFDHVFNLGYGRRYTDGDPILAGLRARLDRDTARLAGSDDGP